ncbi:MAG: AMP-binding protein [Salinarimonas sp.]|nr:AMP-binding protein [Salinarimonas sp.]
MNIATWLEQAGRSNPDAPAVGLGKRVAMDYATLAGRAARFAGALQTRFGLAPGDRVALVTKNCPQFLEVLWGTWWAGCACVPVNAKLHGAEIGYILERSGARICIVGDDLTDAVAAHAPAGLEALVRLGGADYARLFTDDPAPCLPVPGSDLAWLFFTSGTTGRPKGAMLTHDNLIAASYAYAAEVDPVRAGDTTLLAAPMSHGAGLYIMAHVLGRGVNVVPESGGFDPAEIFDLAAHWRNASMFAAPTMVKRMTAAGAEPDTSAFRTIIYGGAPMYVEDAVRALDRFGPCFAQIYGQGESPMTITRLSREEIGDRDHPRWRERLATAGVTYGNVDVAIADEAGRHLPPGETGEIICRGAPVMPGYWNDPQATAKTLRDGWLFTGDVGSIDAFGYLSLKDRSKDLIISGGTNIYPREVEEVLLTHPDVREVSVIGRPDPEWGEIVVAYVVGDADAATLDALCLSQIARFKRPKHYRFVDALPKNNYGKILKTRLREIDESQREDG